jgi:hypothetical protein
MRLALILIQLNSGIEVFLYICLLHFIKKGNNMPNKSRQKTKDYIQSCKTVCATEGCGETDKTKLTFHHRPGETKLFDIGDGPRMSIGAVRREIAKCDVYCRDCHDKIDGITPNATGRKRPRKRISGSVKRRRRRARLLKESANATS